MIFLLANHFCGPVFCTRAHTQLTRRMYCMLRGSGAGAGPPWSHSSFCRKVPSYHWRSGFATKWTCCKPEKQIFPFLEFGGFQSWELGAAGLGCIVMVWGAGPSVCTVVKLMVTGHGVEESRQVLGSPWQRPRRTWRARWW